MFFCDLRHSRVRGRVTIVRGRGTLCRFRILGGRVGPRFLFGDLGILTSLTCRSARGAGQFTGGLSAICHCLLAARNETAIAIRRRLSFMRSCLCLRRVHFNSTLRIRVRSSLQGRRYLIVPTDVRVLIRGTLGRGVDAGGSPLVIRVSVKGRKVAMHGGLRLHGCITDGKTKLGGLRQRCTLCNALIRVLGSRGRFIIGLPFINKSIGHLGAV